MTSDTTSARASEIATASSLNFIGGLVTAMNFGFRISEFGFKYSYSIIEEASFSLQVSEMFIATSLHPEDLAPLGAKPGSGTIADAGKGDCAPTELRSKERTAKL